MPLGLSETFDAAALTRVARAAAAAWLERHGPALPGPGVSPEDLRDAAAIPRLLVVNDDCSVGTGRQGPDGAMRELDLGSVRWPGGMLEHVEAAVAGAMMREMAAL